MDIFFTTFFYKKYLSSKALTKIPLRDIAGNKNTMYIYYWGKKKFSM